MDEELQRNISSSTSNNKNEELKKWNANVN
jgi:hypothetical protein